MTQIDSKIKGILKAYSNAMGKDKQFYHILDHIGKHIIKLTRLKENEDRPGHFKEEVADMYLLAKSLMELENIDEKTLKAASKHFLEKVESIYNR